MTEKIATKPKTFGIKDAYAFYVEAILKANPAYKGRRKYSVTNGEILKEDGTLYIDYKGFKRILSLYFIKAGVSLIKGLTFSLGAGLGDIYLLRQGRNPLAQPKLNRGESFRRRKLMKEKGEEITNDNWKVYYTDEEFTKTTWMRPSYIENLQFYGFSPANGQAGKGFKQTMSRTITSNPAILALYPFLPHKKSA